MYNYLPERIRNSMQNFDLSFLYEIRLRLNYPIKCIYSGQVKYLTYKGLSDSYKDGIIVSQDDIKFILDCVTEKSIYVFNDRIKNGYITTKHGHRIGIAGEIVYDNGQVITISKITSLNIRIPHRIKNCGHMIYNELLKKELNNVLIVSPPFYGKTTVLKDLCYQINDNTTFDILLVDERGEFIDVSGNNIDKITYCNKEYAFNYAIRSMSPKVIITDELSSKNDFTACRNASNSGVKVIASAHAQNYDELKNKEYFIDGIFDYYVELNPFTMQNKIKNIIKSK